MKEVKKHMITYGLQNWFKFHLFCKQKYKQAHEIRSVNYNTYVNPKSRLDYR